MIKILQQKRKRLSFLMACVTISIVFLVIISLSGFFFSVSVFEHQRNSLSLIESAFSKSLVCGIAFELIYVFVGLLIAIINTQRLRDMGYRMPVVISIFLMLLNFVSCFFSWLGGINFISIIVDVGLTIFFFIMLFTSSKVCSQEKTSWK